MQNVDDYTIKLIITIQVVNTALYPKVKLFRDMSRDHYVKTD